MHDRPICLVTGAAGGIGEALVSKFHNAGYSVLATDISEKPTGMICDHYIQADLDQIVNDEGYSAIIFDRIRKYIKGRGLSALINNAAVQILRETENLTREDWQKTLTINLLAPFFITQAFISELESANGCIVNISSIHAKLSKRNFVAYATSKAALSGMTRFMALDLGGRVRINAIEPAAIETDMLQKGFSGDLKGYKALKSYHPINRIGEPDEVANLALAMVSGGMGFLHGACVGIDGGIGAKLFDPN
ncbi:MAG: SDR family oxidoreductase [Chlorobium sp.]